MYPLRWIRLSWDARVVVRLTAKVELAFSDGVYCRGCLNEELWGELDHGLEWRPFQTQHQLNEANATRTAPPMRPVYQRLNLSVLLFLVLLALTHKYRFVVGHDAYTFAPVEPLGAQSLTIHRSTGDIVLNRELSPKALRSC